MQIPCISPTRKQSCSESSISPKKILSTSYKINTFIYPNVWWEPQRELGVNLIEMKQRAEIKATAFTVESYSCNYRTFQFQFLSQIHSMNTTSLRTRGLLWFLFSESQPMIIRWIYKYKLTLVTFSKSMVFYLLRWREV